MVGVRTTWFFMLLSSSNIVNSDKYAPSELTSIKNENKTDKSIEFLHMVKADLRRNNDDYAEAVPRRNTSNAPPDGLNDLKFHYKNDIPNNMINNLNRRAYDSLSEEDNANSKEIKTKIYTPVKRFFKITQTTTIKTHTKLKNMSKLKMFFAKNSALLKQFLRNKGLGTTLKMNEDNEVGHNIRMKARENNKQIVLPNSEQLDMAPAKGGRIHMLRIKGRLCQRNVLIPEGPKYDSNGKIYLPEFSSALKHKDFEMTISPKLILPRCCNCCKKSVLGCE